MSIGRFRTKPNHITPETPSDFSWAAQHIELLCGLNGLILNVEQRNIVSDRLLLFAGNSMRWITKSQRVLFYLFHKIWKGASPLVPTLISVDEFRSSLEQPIAVQNFEKCLDGRPQKNMALLLAIQELPKIQNSLRQRDCEREAREELQNKSKQTVAGAPGTRAKRRTAGENTLERDPRRPAAGQ